MIGLLGVDRLGRPLIDGDLVRPQGVAVDGDDLLAVAIHERFERRLVVLGLAPAAVAPHLRDRVGLRRVMDAAQARAGRAAG